MTIDFYGYIDKHADGGTPLCAETDPEAFFPDKGALGDLAAARRVCARCEVRDACREWGVLTNPPVGVLGGWTYRQRLAELKRRREAEEQQPAA